MIEDVLKNNNVIPKVSTKKNLRRNIENTFSKKFIFVNIDRILYLYPNTLTMEKLVADFISIQSAAAVDIKKQIKQIQDGIPWPPEPQNLSPDQYKMPEGLKTFLDVLYSGSNKERELNPRTSRYKFQG